MELRSNPSPSLTKARPGSPAYLVCHNSRLHLENSGAPGYGVGLGDLEDLDTPFWGEVVKQLAPREVAAWSYPELGHQAPPCRPRSGEPAAGSLPLHQGYLSWAWLVAGAG